MPVTQINSWITSTCCSRRRRAGDTFLGSPSNDLDPAACDTVRAGPHGGLFAPDRFTVGKSGAKNNWAKGHYSEGAEIVDKVVDSLRTEIEACDCAQGIQLFHSTGGGTGAGLGTLTIAKIREEFPDRVMSTFSVVPSAKVSDVVVEPYNAILTSQHLIENSDMTFLFDNEAAYGICTETLGLATPTCAWCSVVCVWCACSLQSSLVFVLRPDGDLNYITASAINGLTAGMRYPGLLNSDLRKLCVNLVPFPRLHFMCLSFAPLMPHGLADYKEMSVREMIPSLFSGTSRLGGGSIQYGKTLTAAALFRGGSVSAQEVDEEVRIGKREHRPSIWITAVISPQMVNVQNKLSSRFVEWIGSNCSTSMCYVPPKGFKTSALLVDNSTGTQEVFKREAERFTALFRRKVRVWGQNALCLSNLTSLL